MRKKTGGLSSSRGDTVLNAVIMIITVVALLVCAYPLYYVLLASFSAPQTVNSGTILLYPNNINLDGYKQIMNDSRIWTGYRNTLFYTVAGTLLSVFITLMATTQDSTGGIFYINRKWLETLGLNAPTTTDELYDVLVAFRDKDPNGNGQRDEIPMAFCEASWATYAALGCHRCGTYIFSWSDELDFAANFRQHVYRLRLCAEVLAEYSITLALEFLGPMTLYDGHKYKFIHTLKEMLELGDAIGTGNLNIMLDAYHCYSAGMGPDEFIGVVRSQKDIGIVHINDAPKGQALDTLPDTLRYLPGEGKGINVIAFLAALKKIGYTGPVVCEPFSQRLNAMNDIDDIMTLVKASFDSVWPV